MKKVEYRVVDSNVYNKCLNLANELLNQISAQSQIPVSKIFPKDIILYFESNYNINFSFFESKKNEIIYKDLVQNPDFIILDDSLVHRTSGLTMPKKDRTLIFINQSMPLTRIKFTILHELTHLYYSTTQKWLLLHKISVLQNFQENILMTFYHLKMKPILSLHSYFVQLQN